MIPKHLAVMGLVVITLCVGGISSALAAAAGQSVPYLSTSHTGSSSPFDYNHGAVDCPMAVNIPDGHAIASPVGAGDYEERYIEAGWTRYGPNSMYPSCESRYCFYSTYGGAIRGSKGTEGGEMYTWIQFKPGARPWFSVQLDHDTNKWWSRWLYWSQWWNMLWAEFDETAFQDVFSGVEASHVLAAVDTHRHNDNAYSQRDFSGTAGWCYGGIRSRGFPNAIVSSCSNYEWTQTINW